MTAAAPTIAVVGAGPAGLFTMDAALRQAPHATVDVYERLPTPFGLIRAGVAPDHQGTKAVVRQFERAFSGGRARLIADCEVGRRIALSRLQEAYDLVFVATGASQPRRLDVPGEDLPGVCPAGALMAWINGHPDFHDLQPPPAGRLVIVGGGNVAVDVARVLAKTEAELASSDLCSHARHITGAVTSITIAVRSKPEAARFAPAELLGLGRLAAATIRPQMSVTADPASPIVQALRTLEGMPRAGPLRVRIRFELTPLEIGGSRRVEFIRFRRADGAVETVPAEAVVTAVGHQAAATPELDRTYAVGWASGSRGDIPASRAQAAAAVGHALQGVNCGLRQGAREALAAELQDSASGLVDWAGWKRIDAAETGAATPPRPREKLVTWEGLRSAARRCNTF